METQKIDLPSISDSEWEVMKLLWENSPLSSHQIIDQLSHREWSPKTIKTLIHRLEKKGAVDHSQSGREYQYYPLVKKQDYVRKESSSFIEKLFNGATAPMVAHFIKSKNMSSDELDSIRKLIDELEDSSSNDSRSKNRSRKIVADSER